MTLLDGGGVFGVCSSTASAVKLLILDPEDTSDVLHEIPLEETAGGIWTAGDDRLTRGIKYVLRAEGPQGPRHAFNPERNLLDPYARGLVRVSPKDYHCVAIDTQLRLGGCGEDLRPL